MTVYGLSPAVQPKDRPIPPIGVVHSHAIKPEFQETAEQRPARPAGNAPRSRSRNSTDRSRVLFPTGVSVTQRNTPALFGDGLLDAIPEEALHAEQRRNSDLIRLVGLSRAKDSKIRGRVARLPNGRLGRFGWKAEFASLDDFVRAACANELGLSNPARAQATSLAKRDYQPKGTDLTDAQCVLIGDFLRDLPAPVQVVPSEPTEEGTRRERSQAVRGDRLRRLPYARPRADQGVLLEPPAPRHGIGTRVEHRLLRRAPRPSGQQRRGRAAGAPTSGGRRRSGAWPTRPPTSTTAGRIRWKRPSPRTAARHPTSRPSSRLSHGRTRTTSSPSCGTLRAPERERLRCVPEDRVEVSRV